VPVTIEEFVGHWLDLGPSERTYLGHEGPVLGSGAALGGRVWDRQCKLRVRLGPLSRGQYESFLPGGTPLTKLLDWVRLYLGFELDWDAQLVLRREDVPALRLGSTGQLGWTTWLGSRRSTHDADDLCLDAETLAARFGSTAHE